MLRGEVFGKRFLAEGAFSRFSHSFELLPPYLRTPADHVRQTPAEREHKQDNELAFGAQRIVYQDTPYEGCC